MTTPSRDLVANELVGYLNALKKTSPRKRKPFTWDMVRNARRNGQLVGKIPEGGRDYVFTPEAVEAWIQAGCRTGKAKEAGE